MPAAFILLLGQDGGCFGKKTAQTVKGRVDYQLLRKVHFLQKRVGKTVMLVGKKQVDVKYIGAGDIGAIPKLTATNTGDTLCSPTRKVTLDGVEYPNPTLRMAIVPAKKGEEDKVAQGMMRLSEEDPTLQFSTNNETHEMILSGLGEQHLDVAVSKLKSKFGVDVTLKKPKVPYRETIRKTVQVQGRHKKQTGGHGQFGDVWIEFSPCDSEGLEFGERVVGGSVPKGFFPAVEKGLRECIQRGPLAGYPVVGLSAVLYDGSYHPVDSSEMAFKIAGSMAFKEAMKKCDPVIMEPIMKVAVIVPDEYMGDVMGDLNARRGQIQGMEAMAGTQRINAMVPLSEMFGYATDLRSKTQGRGQYSMEPADYQQVPKNIADKIMTERAKNA